MCGPWSYYAKWNKLDEGRRIPYNFTHMWNIKIKQGWNKYLGTENKVVVITVQGMWEESEMGKRSQLHVNEWKLNFYQVAHFSVYRSRNIMFYTWNIHVISQCYHNKEINWLFKNRYVVPISVAHILKKKKKMQENIKIRKVIFKVFFFLQVCLKSLLNLLQYWYCFYYVLVFQPWDLWDLCSLRATHPHFSVHRNCPGKNTGGGGHFLRQGIFLTQGSNLCLLHQQADSLLTCANQEAPYPPHQGSNWYPQPSGVTIQNPKINQQMTHCTIKEI